MRKHQRVLGEGQIADYEDHCQPWETLSVIGGFVVATDVSVKCQDCTDARCYQCEEPNGA